MLKAQRTHLSRRDVPDALFPSDNAFDIPTLDLNMQADFVDLPVMTWGSVKRNQIMSGCWHFYTQDYRFEALWSDPTPIVNSRCVSAVEPNFTIGEQMPRAVALYQIYRKRWLARYWQTQGKRLFVDLNVAPAWYEENLLGVPQGWKAWMTRGYTDFMEGLAWEYALAVERAGTSDILFAVYGGGAEVQDTCRRCGWTWIWETMDMVKGKNDG